MNRRKLIFLSIFTLLVVACKEKYVAPLTQPVTGYLVVEGFINSGTGPTVITITRTAKLSDTATFRKEARATVRVEAKSGVTVVLPETSLGSGVYSGTPVIKTGDQYRLSITTSAGRAYVSDYSEVRRTVDIDSISWMRAGDGVHFYANTHDPNNSTHYYRYSFDETWEFHSQYKTALKFFIDNMGAIHVGYRDSSTFAIDSSIFKCWKNATSTDIILASSEKLDMDKISMLPLHFIENNSWKLSVLYSLNVKQYALSRDAYRYFDQLRKNTQQLGSIFDAQPSDNIGNIHCVNDPNEPVLGFVEVSEEKQKRVFLNTVQVAPWVFDRGCPGQIWRLNTPDSLKGFLTFIPTLPKEVSGEPTLTHVYFEPPECVDCLQFGVNVKPTFWP